MERNFTNKRGIVFAQMAPFTQTLTHT